MCIVSNARLNWLHFCFSFLPSFQGYLKSNPNSVKVISAQDLFRDVTSDVSQWKSLTYKTTHHFNMKAINKLIAVGDHPNDLDSAKNFLKESHSLGTTSKQFLGIKLKPEGKVEEIVAMVRAMPEIIINNQIGEVETIVDVTCKK